MRTPLQARPFGLDAAGPPARLRRTSDVRRVLRARAGARGPSMAIHAAAAPSWSRQPRVAIVAGRRVGNAVTRNRVKRRLRAAAREATLANGMDYVIVAGPQAAGRPYSGLRTELSELAGRAASRSATVRR